MKQNPYVACNTHGLVQQSTVLYTYGSLSFDRDTIVKQFRIFGPNWSSYWWTFAACSLLLFFVRLAPSWFHMQIHATTMLYATLCRSVQHSSDLWHAAFACGLQLCHWWWKGCAAAMTTISISETMQAYYVWYICMYTYIYTYPKCDSWSSLVCVCLKLCRCVF